MTLFRLRVMTLVTSRSLSWLKTLLPATSPTNIGSPTEARLHTATSSGAVYSTISVHRLEQLMVPRFCWLLLRLHASCHCWL